MQKARLKRIGVSLCLLVLLLANACSSSNENASLEPGTTDSGTAGSVSAGSSTVGSSTTGSATSGSSTTGSGTADSGTTGSGTSDSGTTGSGTSDSGTSDSGTSDSGTSDSGTSDSGTSDSGTSDSGSSIPLEHSCNAYPDDARNPDSGFFTFQLPADLSSTGSVIELSSVLSPAPVSFDPLSGVISFLPNNSRLSESIRYKVIDQDGAVLVEHEHKLVFAPIRIMPLGDSITAGVEFFDGEDLPERSLRVGYRQFLYDDLLLAGYQIDYQGQGGQSAGADAGLADPENNGYPGVDISFIENIMINILDEDDVDVVLLHIGTNSTPTEADGIDRILDLIDDWEEAHHPIVVLVATLVPKRDATRNAVVDTFNDDVRLRVSQREDDLVFLVEQNLAVDVADISDEPIGLHPSAVGYEKMADAWERALIDRQILQQCPE